MPQFRLTIVPFLWSEKPDSAVLRVTREMAADPLHHEVLWKMNTLLPIADDYDLVLHEPVVTEINIQRLLTLKTEAIRVMEGSDRYHMGTMTGEVVATNVNNTGRRTISTLVEEGKRRPHHARVRAHDDARSRPGLLARNPGWTRGSGVPVLDGDHRSLGVRLSGRRRPGAADASRRDGHLRRLVSRLDQRLPFHESASPPTA